MKIEELFAKVINKGTAKGINPALAELKLSQTKIEKVALSKKPFIVGKDFDLVFDTKPKIKHLYIYLTPKKFTKKVLKSLRPNEIDFKSLVIYLGVLKMKKEMYEVRLGCYGIESSDLVKAVVKK
jgi:hypothetical protein